MANLGSSIVNGSLRINGDLLCNNLNNSFKAGDNITLAMVTESGIPKLQISSSGGSNITVDTSLNSTSKNPVQNSTIYTALASKLDSTATAANASRLSNTVAIGSTAQPVYFTASGVPAVCTMADSTSNAALTTGNNLVTERDVYYGLIRVNGASQSRAKVIYAPITGGTSGYILKASGATSTPIWTPISSVLPKASSSAYGVAKIYTSGTTCYIYTT